MSYTKSLLILSIVALSITLMVKNPFIEGDNLS